MSTGTIEEAVQTILVNAGITAYSEFVPAPNDPYVVYSIEEGLAWYNLDGASGLEVTRMQFNIYSNTAAGRATMVRTLNNLLGGYRDTVTIPGSPAQTVQIMSCQLVQKMQSFEEYTQERQYVTVLDFEIVHTV